MLSHPSPPPTYCVSEGTWLFHKAHEPAPAAQAPPLPPWLSLLRQRPPSPHLSAFTSSQGLSSLWPPHPHRLTALDLLCQHLFLLFPQPCSHSVKRQKTFRGADSYPTCAPQQPASGSRCNHAPHSEPQGLLEAEATGPSSACPASRGRWNCSWSGAPAALSTVFLSGAQSSQALP